MIAIHAALASWSGYGLIAENLARALVRQRHDVAFSPFNRDERFRVLSPFVAERIRPVERIDLTIATPLDVPGPEGPRSDVLFTMWESSRLPAASVADLNRFPVVVVPCRANRDWFIESGVRVPILLAPLGCEPPAELRPLPRDPIVFGTAGRVSGGGSRKGLSECMRAFAAMSADRNDVRLEVKCFPDCLRQITIPDDPRITVNTDPYSPTEMGQWYDRLTCYVTASKGEGWGLHTLEAMAHGRPIVAAQWSGTADFFDSRYGWRLPFELAPAEGLYAGCGDWAIPHQRSLEFAFSSVSALPGRLLDGIGRNAARRAREFSWERTARSIVSALELAAKVNTDRFPAGLPAWSGSCVSITVHPIAGAAQ